jgi:hypothetical protein
MLAGHWMGSGDVAVLNAGACASNTKNIFVGIQSKIVVVGNRREKVIQYLVWLCLGTSAVFSLAGCYNAEDSWKICCRMLITGDETTSSAGRKAIIAWERGTGFSGDGKESVWIDWSRPPYYTWKKNKIASDLTDFLVSNPGAKAGDYFVGLGMTCRHNASIGNDVTRCETELPVWVECASMNVYFPGGAPVPEELRKPIAALLAVSIDVSASEFLDTSTRVLPVPGGRLCHR